MTSAATNHGPAASNQPHGLEVIRMATTPSHPKRSTASALAAALAVLCLIVAAAAPAGTTTPALTLGPVSVANGAATVSGNVGTNPDGSVVAATTASR